MYPDMAAVERAGLVSLVRWLRFLPSPTDEQRPAMERIVERAGELRDADNGAWVAASKRVGRGEVA